MDTNTIVDKTYTDPETGKFRPGNPGGGRPKGSISIKDKVRQHLENHPEEVEAVVTHFVKNNRELMWQMLEGRPHEDKTLKHEFPETFSEFYASELDQSEGTTPEGTD